MIVSIINKYKKTVSFDTGPLLLQGIKSEYQRKNKNMIKYDKGNQIFSKELYAIDKREGYKLMIKDKKRKLNP